MDSNRSVPVFLILMAVGLDVPARQRNLARCPEREKSDRDYADILAPIDPAFGGREIARAGFHKGLILRIPNLDNVRKRYQRMSREDIQRICEDFVSIV